MKPNSFRIAATLLIFMFTANSQIARPQQLQSPAPSDSAAILGVWRGQIGGLPGVTLVVSDEGGSLAGAVLFYFQQRKTVNDPWTSTPRLPEPMFNLHLDGATLTFQVSHRRAHPPGSLADPPVTYHLTLTGPNEAKLLDEHEHEGPQLVMVRSDY